MTTQRRHFPMLDAISVNALLRQCIARQLHDIAAGPPANFHEAYPYARMVADALYVDHCPNEISGYYLAMIKHGIAHHPEDDVRESIEFMARAVDVPSSDCSPRPRRRSSPEDCA